MIRRDFFEWIGKVSVALGLGFLSARAGDETPVQSQAVSKPGSNNGPAPRRMNGRACHDYRLMSDDRSMMLDGDIFGG